MAARALSDLHVLDLSDGIAGAYCTKLLADHGAEVIKIEPPDTGDRLRALGPWRDDVPDGEIGGLHLYLNGGKKSVTLDLSTQSGVVILRKLLRQVDVLVESFQPDSLAAAGLGYDDLKDEFPDLIYATVTPFGRTGPWRDFTGDAFVAYATGGLMYVTGDPEREPLANGADSAEYFAGQNLAIGILSALAWRDAGGGGQRVETSLMEAIAANNEYGTVLYSFMGAVRRRWYSRHPFRYPSDIFACRDGHVAVLFGRLGLQELAVVIERPDLIDHELFVDSAARYLRWREFEELLRPYLESHTAREIVEAGQDLHQPFALVPTIADLLADPHLAEREYFVEIQHPQAGALSYPGPPWRMSATPWQTGRAPLLGEHSAEILSGDATGYDQTDLTVLRERGII
jgi:crotonobetainyl-CoA:carnitine CoA-transferase CaiB-like acyl-CoA transferase